MIEEVPIRDTGDTIYIREAACPACGSVVVIHYYTESKKMLIVEQRCKHFQELKLNDKLSPTVLFKFEPKDVTNIPPNIAKILESPTIRLAILNYLQESQEEAANSMRIDASDY